MLAGFPLSRRLNANAAVVLVVNYFGYEAVHMSFGFGVWGEPVLPATTQPVHTFLLMGV